MIDANLAYTTRIYPYPVLILPFKGNNLPFIRVLDFGRKKLDFGRKKLDTRGLDASPHIALKKN